MASGGGFRVTELPADLSLLVLRRLRGHDLVAACRASQLWESLVCAEGVWQQACCYRWPHVFGGAGAAASDAVDPAAPPLEMPPWTRHDPLCAIYATHDCDAIPRSTPSDAHATWRAHYMQRDMYEAFNVAPTRLSEDAVLALQNELEKALRWCSPLIATVAVELPLATGLVERCPRIRTLRLAHEVCIRDDEREKSCARPVPVILRRAVSGDIPSFARLTSLSVPHARLIENTGVELVLHALRECGTALTELDLSGNPLRTKGAEALGEALVPNGVLPDIRSLRLSAAQLGNAGAEALCRALAGHVAIRELDLAMNGIGVEGAVKIARHVLKTAPSPATGSLSDATGGSPGVHVSDPSAGAHVAQLGVHVAPPACKLDERILGLELDQSPHVPGHAVPSSAAAGPSAVHAASPSAAAGPSANGGLSTSPPDSPGEAGCCTLASLDLSRNPLGDEGVLAIAYALESNSHLRTLMLHYVNFDPNLDSADTATRIEPFPLTPLLRARGLERLELRLNYIGQCGYTLDQLREALAGSSRLRTLDLTRCCIGGWRRARTIIRGIAANATLTEVDLGYNGLGAACQTPTHPDGSANGTGSRGTPSLAVNTLCEALRENTRLRRVGLAHNVLGDVGATAIVGAALSRCSRPHALDLDMRSNGISVGSLRTLCAALGGVGARWLPAAGFGGLGGDAGFGAPLAPAEPAGASRTARLLCPPRALGAPADDGTLFVDLRQNATLEAIVRDQAAAAADGAMKPDAIMRCTSGLTLDGPSLHAAVGPAVTRSPPLCPHYMSRQVELCSTMRTTLIDWLVELYEELPLPTEVLLAGVHHVDRFLSAEAVKKEVPERRAREMCSRCMPSCKLRWPGSYLGDLPQDLQLVGAVALLISSNNFCKLPPQDGEPAFVELNDHGLNTADDVVYWTDSTYTVPMVLAMEARLLRGLELGEFESPLQILATYLAAAPQRDTTVAIAQELLVQCAREYETLALHPRLLAACCLRIALRNTPGQHGCDIDNDDFVARACGYAPEVLTEHIATTLRFTAGMELSCRPLNSAGMRLSVVLQS